MLHKRSRFLSNLVAFKKFRLLAPTSDIQITSELFYSQVMYQETCAKLLRGREINGAARERPWYFFVIIFLEFPVRTYLRRERHSVVFMVEQCYVDPLEHLNLTRNNNIGVHALAGQYRLSVFILVVQIWEGG